MSPSRKGLTHQADTLSVRFRNVWYLTNPIGRPISRHSCHLCSYWCEGKIFHTEVWWLKRYAVVEFLCISTFLYGRVTRWRTYSVHIMKIPCLSTPIFPNC